MEISNKYPLSMVRGTTEAITFSFSEDSIFQPGDIMVFGIKKRYLDNEYVFKYKTNKIANNEATVSLKPEDTSSLHIGDYFYDLGLIRGTDFFTLVECSDFTLKPNITEKGSFND